MPAVIKVLDWKYPTRPSPGYKTFPDFDQLILKMTKEQLSKVEDFTIENKHGRIQFLGPTDLTDVDLARDVVIKARSVDVYPNTTPPAVKSKLNKPALITLEGGIKPKHGLSAEAYETQL